MPFLVDGNNLMGMTAGLSLRDASSRTKLVQRICAYQRRKGGRYTIFFDGEPATGLMHRESKLGGVAVRYSGAGVTADEVMVKFLRKTARPKEHIVISSDRELVTQCRHLGAKSMSCAELNRAIREQEGTSLRSWEAPLSKSEIEKWLKIFE